MGACIKCHSQKTKIFTGDDGHFRKECLDCGYIGGPYISKYIEYKMDEKEDNEEDKESIFDY